MGNRGTILFSRDGAMPDVGYYLHWNGGPESVFAFVAELDRRAVTNDNRFYQVVAEFFDYNGARPEHGSLSLYVFGTGDRHGEPISAAAIADLPADLGDNGAYVIDRTAGTVRRFAKGVEWDADDQPIGWPMFELEATAVDRELADAARSDHATALAQFYRDLDRRLDVAGPVRFGHYGFAAERVDPLRGPYAYRPARLRPERSAIADAQRALAAIGPPT